MDSNHYTSGAFGLVQRHRPLNHADLLSRGTPHILEAKTLAGYNWTTYHVLGSTAPCPTPFICNLTFSITNENV